MYMNSYLLKIVKYVINNLKLANKRLYVSNNILKNVRKGEVWSRFHRSEI